MHLTLRMISSLDKPIIKRQQDLENRMGGVQAMGFVILVNTLGQYSGQMGGLQTGEQSLITGCPEIADISDQREYASKHSQDPG